MGRQHGEIIESFTLGLQDGHGMRRSGRFKADAEEDDLLVGVVASDLQRFHRRIHDANVAALGLYVEQIFFRTGDAQHITIRYEDDVWEGGYFDGLVYYFQRRDAHWTA